MANDSQMLTKLIQDAVLKICSQYVRYKTSMEIDGIICISPGEILPDIVVKMHRTILKPAGADSPPWRDDTPQRDSSTRHRRPSSTVTSADQVKDKYDGATPMTHPRLHEATPMTHPRLHGTMPSGEQSDDESGLKLEAENDSDFDDDNDDNEYDTTTSSSLTPSKKRKHSTQPNIDEDDASPHSKQIKIEPNDEEIAVEDDGGGGEFASVPQDQQLVSPSANTIKEKLNNSTPSLRFERTMAERQIEQQPQGKVPLTCDICNVVYKYKEDLNIHMRRVHAAEKIKCKDCPREFCSRRSAREHHKSAHDSVQYQCQDCGNTYKSQRYLRDHIRAVHDVKLHDLYSS